NERVPCVAVDLERLRLAARAVETKHQLPPQTFPKRIGCDERLQFADDLAVPAACELASAGFLQTSEPQVVQDGDFGPGKVLVCELRERRSSPKRKRVLEPALLPQPP